MAQSYTVPRAIRRLLGKCQRGSHLRASPSPSPQPSPLGRGRILRWLSAQPSAVSARRPPEQPKTCRRLFPLPVGEGQGEGNALAVRRAPRTLAEIVEIRESSDRAGGFP